jgi:hypothetical protein
MTITAEFLTERQDRTPVKSREKDTMKQETVNSRIINFLRPTESDPKRQARFHDIMMNTAGGDPIYFRKRLRALVKSGVVIMIGRTAGAKYHLVEGW